MPIPGTTAETTAEVAARTIREERAESQRLRDLLTVARAGLETVLQFGRGPVHLGQAVREALRLSDPSRDDTQPGGTG